MRVHEIIVAGKNVQRALIYEYELENCVRRVGTWRVWFKIWYEEYVF